MSIPELSSRVAPESSESCETQTHTHTPLHLLLWKLFLSRSYLWEDKKEKEGKDWKCRVLFLHCWSIFTKSKSKSKTSRKLCFYFAFWSEAVPWLSADVFGPGFLTGLWSNMWHSVSSPLLRSMHAKIVLWTGATEVQSTPALRVFCLHSNEALQKHKTNLWQQEEPKVSSQWHINISVQNYKNASYPEKKKAEKAISYFHYCGKHS